MVRLPLAAALVAALAVPAGAQLPVEVLEPRAAIAAHVVSGFTQPVVYARGSDGRYVVLDRRAHTVFLVDADGQSARQVIGIGNEPGRLLRPVTMALGPNDLMAVVDLPAEHQRIQFFTIDGRLAGGFLLAVTGAQHVVADAIVTGGTTALAFDGQFVWLNVPAWGALMTGMDMTGQVVRHVGRLRRTGHEDRPELHHAFNAGFPLAGADGSFTFVFQVGVPVLRRYDAAGQLVHERHIEGQELDPIIQRLPGAWPESADGSRPLPAPVVRAAAIDGAGRTWVALETGHLYVYDRGGDKRQVVTFGGAASDLPTSLTVTHAGHLLAGPGGYEFDLPPIGP